LVSMMWTAMLYQVGPPDTSEVVSHPQ
jgi:hypothetical protein